ncbi:MAG: amino acid ABC transporter ATP-binding protein, partial [Candidimonas sp.]
VFQHFNLWPHRTALGNVTEALVRVKKMSRTEADRVGMEMLGVVGLLDKADVYPDKLSGGQKQRVAIARALALDPEVMLFDEPTSALDPELVGEVLSVMQKLAENEVTMVIVTHEMGFAAGVADEIIFMDKGKLVERGSVKEVLRSPENPRLQQFLSTWVNRNTMWTD